MRAFFRVGVFLVVCGWPLLGSAYSVLTHEQIIDLLWKDQIQPLLLKRFPNASPDDLRKAHAYAYGGSLIQDMGYYPFGSKYFSDLTHYVRTGDFVTELIQQSSDLNSYAFALGALAHYSSDICGHPSINRSVALTFPKLEQKYGKEVTYEDDPKTHIRTEFGFDMVQVAKNRYTSDVYHDFIGFNIDKPALEQAFQQTYDIKLSDVIHNEDLAFGSFRRAVSKVIPEMTRIALLNRKTEIVHDTPNFNKQKFLYHLSRANYEKEWGKGYRRPGFGARVLAFFLKIVPKVGPFKAVDFKIPSTATEDLYIKSIDQTVDNYGSLLREAGTGKLQLTDSDLDTGRPSGAGEYGLADKTYAHLLDDLSKRDFAGVKPALQQNILGYFRNAKPPADSKKNRNSPQDWAKTQQELKKLEQHSLDQESSPVAVDSVAGASVLYTSAVPVN